MKTLGFVTWRLCKIRRKLLAEILLAAALLRIQRSLSARLGGQTESSNYLPAAFATGRGADSGGSGIDHSAEPQVCHLIESVSFYNQELVRRARGLDAILHR